VCKQVCSALHSKLYLQSSLHILPSLASYNVVQAKTELGTASDPEKAKLLMDKEKLDALLEQYMSLPAGVLYQRSMAAYVAASQNYNDLVLKISYMWTSLTQSQKDRAAMSAQIAEARVSILCERGIKASAMIAI
jgi:hypothetical protein